MPKIPEGWNDYTPIGKRIPETRFICFKVPLQKSLSAEHRFTPDDLIKSLAERHISLGLVIDLTNTNKYYNPQCFTKAGVGHVKINVAGRVVPEPAVNKQFARSVEKFMEENGDNDKLIGVHCTHGLNRTGYVVCKHMIDHMAFTPEKALEVFNTARGHCVERDNFIDALHGRPCHSERELYRRKKKKARKIPTAVLPDASQVDTAAMVAPTVSASVPVDTEDWHLVVRKTRRSKRGKVTS